MPTANLAPGEMKLLPPEGVYASKTFLHKSSQWFYSVTNIGHNPTVGDHNALRVETYLLDFAGDLYGEEITVSLYCHTRGERKFKDLMELREQVEKDKQQAVVYFEKYGL
jgi:riboflavin kinase/FMN adenylyltransferase